MEAEREERQSRLGYIEPRAARNFLALARSATTPDRDPVTRAYFRDLQQPTVVLDAQVDSFAPRIRGLLRSTSSAADTLQSASARALSAPESELPLVEALRALSESEPTSFGERMEEIAYLTNVLVAGASTGAARFGVSEAAEAALATVAYGAELIARELGSVDQGDNAWASQVELCRVLKAHCADMLFRKASSTLASKKGSNQSLGFLRSGAELREAVRALRVRRTKKG